MFSVACVKNSVHMGGLPQCMGYHHPIPPTPPLVVDPPGHRPPRHRHPPRADTPLRSACWELRSTSGWYRSYWNAILFSLNMDLTKERRILDSNLILQSSVICHFMGLWKNSVLRKLIYENMAVCNVSEITTPRFILWNFQNIPVFRIQYVQGESWLQVWFEILAFSRQGRWNLRPETPPLQRFK